MSNAARWRGIDHGFFSMTAMGPTGDIVGIGQYKAKSEPATWPVIDDISYRQVR